MLNSKPTRRLLPIVGMLAFLSAGCGSPPATDETDPLPRIFDNKKIDPSRFGAALGRETGGGMQMPMEMDPSHRHEHVGESGSEGGDQKATTKKAADEKSEEPPATDGDKPNKSETNDPKKVADPATESADSGKQDKKEGSDKEQP